MKTGLIIFIVILVIFAIILIFFNPILLFIEKLTFKDKVGKLVHQIAVDYDYYLLNEVAMKIGNHVIHFDHLLFGDKYIFCIVSRYYPIGVDGNFNDAQWFNYKSNGKCVMMKNPMRLNRERVDYFATAITSSKDMFVGMVLVNDSCLIKEIDGASNNDLILNVKDLEKIVNKFENNKDVSIIEPELLNVLVKDIHKKCIEK